MSLIKHKKVELTELFYDLVYVYTISQLTSIIHHVHHGVLSFQSLFSFVVGMVIFINSWMVQTVYTNRFGNNSLRNILFMFLQMVCLLVSSRAVAGDWQVNFVWIILPMAGISLLLLLQYITEYLLTSDEDSRRLIRPFFSVLGLRTIGLLVALAFPYEIGLWIAVLSVGFTWILPGFLNTAQRQQLSDNRSPMNFPHLMERLSLLIIITFGEMLIGISEHFSSDRFSVLSILIFIIVASLFMIYIVEMDHLIEVNRSETGNRAIYAHYPIFFGLSLVTAALALVGNAEVSGVFEILCFYSGLAFFVAGLLTHSPYNKAGRKFSPSLLALEWAVPALGLLISLLFFRESSSGIIAAACLVTFAMTAAFVRFHIQRSRSY